MLSALPSIYVEYKNLAKADSIAEIQKDLIVQFMKNLKKDDNIIVDNSNHQKTENEKDINYIVRCIQCNVEVGHDYEIIHSSVNKTKNAFTNQYVFDLRNEKNQKTTWRLEITEKKIIFFISAKSNLLINNILTDKDLEISQCNTDDLKCNPKNYFLNKSDAQSNLIKVTNKRTNTPIRQGKEIDILTLSQEILVHSGEKIKIIYSPTDNLTIQTYGKSLTNGGLGETIRVQISNWFDNSSVSQPAGIIEGTVVAPGEVKYAVKQ
ncbi:flagella basal body P-ring formation protein FlgA [Pigmentibacter sp. JX0631]|uniref:flagella basal body P-ring formation protein FlgA n=1 Tax=Pigmentibacter sp. JX0631 TaxID=2976982 RepID=UPI00246858D2|nr:flagella basal body P-ring formation protein FlgA [Pigmentibacter sp. JX0631]WGL60795.1 flagella basal body P-ring formation protein FlgA [Pigmentibacter sp. JX0631]